MPKLCFGCMRQKEHSPICEICGYDENRANLSHQLPIGTILQNQYLIGRVLGQGGFGITYMGWDQHLSIPVAIKEYYPGGVVQRHTQLGTNVVCANGEEPTLFRKHREKFLKEARTLAQLSEIPEIVQIKSFFSANDTAYIVMEYVDGITLKSHLKQLDRPMTEREALEVMEPVLCALRKVHDLHLIHRDISPDNIMLPQKGGVKLIDFGTVRYVDSSGVSRSTEAVLKPGFAPIEQYNTRGELGTWTDVYALCATFHYLLTGKVPTDVHERLVSGDQLTVLRSRQGISQKMIQTLEKGMKIIPSERIQTIEQLYGMLYPQQKKPHTQKKKQDIKSENLQQAPDHKQQEMKPVKKNNKWLIPALGSVAALIVLGTGILLANSEHKEPAVEAAVVEETTVATTASLQELQYQDALLLMKAGEYDAAMENFLELMDYQDSAYLAEQCRLAIGYEEAEALAEAGEHAKAGIAFAKLGEYQDAHERSLEQWNLSRNRSIIVRGEWNSVTAIREDGTVISDRQELYNGWTDIIDLCKVSAAGNVFGLRADGTVAVPDVEFGESWWQLGNREVDQICNWKNIAVLVNLDPDILGICYDGTVVRTNKRAGISGEELGYSNGNPWDFDVSGWKDIVDIKVDFDGVIALKADGTVLYTGNAYALDAEEWFDIVDLEIGAFGIVGFRGDGTVVVAKILDTDSRSVYIMEDWDNVVSVSDFYRLKRDGTVDAPEEISDYYRRSYTDDSSRVWYPAEEVSVLTGIKSISAYSHFHSTSLYGLTEDNTVVFVGDPYDGSANVQDMTNVVDIFDGNIGLRADGTIVIAGTAYSDAEKWTGIRVPAK